MYYCVNSSNMKIFFRIIPFLLMSSILGAQTIPVKEIPGEVSKYECEFRKYDPDPLASAVILWESCDVDVFNDKYSSGVDVSMHVVQRIKILKESGRHYANGKFTVSSGYGSNESFGQLTVTTYNLENDQVVSYTANKQENIFKSKPVSGKQEISYYAPEVHVGSVIEISYTQTYTAFDALNDFFFQRKIPVNSCTYSVKFPNWLGNRRTVHGQTPLVFSSYSVDNKVIQTFKGVDIPSFRSEPMVYCPDQYISAVCFEIGNPSVVGADQAMCSDWSVVSTYYSISPITTLLHKNSTFRKELREILARNEDEATTLSSIISFVRSKVRWNRETGCDPLDFSFIGESFYGNSADINTLVGSMATEAGFTVTPVLLRYRTDGALREDCPSLAAFSTFILHVVGKDGLDVYLDAADPLGHFNVLSDNCLTVNAMEVFPNGSYSWVDLSSLANNVTTYSVLTTLSPDGKMEGRMYCQYYNVASYNFKEVFGSITEYDELVDILKGYISADATKVTFSELKDYSAKSGMTVDFTKTYDTSADIVTVKPFLVNLISDAAFRKDTRSLPIDFAYPEMITYVFRMNIPEGYEVEQLPQPGAFASELPSKASMKAVADSGEVSVYFTFDNRALHAMPEKYDDIRAYWQIVCDTFASKIILRKIPIFAN